MINEAGLALSLMCAVSFDVSETSSSQMTLNYGTPPISSQTTTARETAGRAFVELGEQDRLRLPRQLLSGRDEGWRTLRDVVRSDTSITAKFTFSTMLNGTVTIDRMTGEIRARWGNLLLGFSSMDGECRPYERSAERLF